MKPDAVYHALSGPIVLDAQKAAFLPASRTLLVADLHFEKGSYLQAAGHAVLPAYDTLETLARLERVIDRYRPRHVIALGDSFHDTQAGERIDLKNLEALNTIIGSVADFTWILGNHDPDIPQGLAGAQEDHLEVDGFLLTHLPVAPDLGQTNVCGHLHPKIKLSLQRRRASYPCFACSETRIILPSFGAYTGGLYVTHDAIKSALGRKTIYALTTPSGLYPMK